MGNRRILRVRGFRFIIEGLGKGKYFVRLAFACGHIRITKEFRGLYKSCIFNDGVYVKRDMKYG
jgi:hypothetical protein